MAGGRGLLRAALPALVGAVGIGLAACLLVWAVTAALRTTPPRLFEQRIASALEQGQLPRSFTVMRTDRFATPRYSGNDCLIADMLVTRAPATSENLASRALYFHYHRPDGDYCTALVAGLGGNGRELVPYHRYVHGYVPGLGLLLLLMPFGAAVALLYGANLLVAGLIVGRAWLRRREERQRPYLLLGVGALLFTGMHSFGWAPSFAFGDLTLLAFLLFCQARGWWAGGDARQFRCFLLACAVFGAATASFEFLTGHLPVAIALILLVFAVERTPDLRRAALGVLAFSLAFASLFLLKLGAIALTDYAGIGSEASGRVGHWLAAGNWDVSPDNRARLLALGIDAETIKANRLLGLFYIVGKFVHHSPHLMVSPLLGAVVMVLAPAALVVLTAASLWRRSIDLPSAAFYVAPLLAIIGWHFLFVSHSIVHSTFMYRTLAWAGVMALTLVLMRPLHRKAPRKP